MEQHDEVEVDVINLFNEELPSVAGNNIETKYTLMMGQPIERSHIESWRRIESLIEHFVAADIYLLTTPMWNFSIPYALKYYIDCVVQPGYLFTYTDLGQPVPLVLGKKMICVTTRGGDYSPGGPMHAYDFQEPYLRTIFGFVGITDIQFVNVQPTDVNLELREAAMTHAIEVVREIAKSSIAESSPSIEATDIPVGLKPQPINK